MMYKSRARWVGGIHSLVKVMVNSCCCMKEIVWVSHVSVRYFKGEGHCIILDPMPASSCVCLIIIDKSDDVCRVYLVKSRSHFICKSPCSVYRCGKARPPNLVGPYNAGLGKFRFMPRRGFGRLGTGFLHIGLW